MMGWKKAGAPKVSSALGVLAPKATDIAKQLALGKGAQAEVNWNKVEAARNLEASRQRFDVEKYRALVRRY
jgi:hypothetical protein